MQWYAHHVSNNPSVVILLVLLMTAVCIIISLIHNDLPSFKDPLLGFESRGTELAQRSTAYKNLKESTSLSGPLTLYPDSITGNISIRATSPHKTEKWSNEMVDVDNSSSYDFVTPLSEIDKDIDDRKFHKEKKMPDEVYGQIIYEKEEKPTPDYPLKADKILTLGSNDFFCKNPGRDYSHVIIKSMSGETLFTAKGLKSVCKMDEEKLRNSSYFPELCEQTKHKSCCRSWSIPNYVSLLRNKTCVNINDTDVKAVLQLLIDCSSFYYEMKLGHFCSSEPALCHDVPKQCMQYDAVYNILHYLADTNFINPKTQDRYPKLTYTAIFLPIAQTSEAFQYYKDLQSMTLWDGVTAIVGMKLGLKYKLFDDCLVHDTLYIGLAGGLLFAFLWIYSSSFFVTFMTIMAVTFSLSTAYFIYTVIYQITFFPFMNLLTIVIIIGIGADDACIYCKIWTCAKIEKNNETSVKLVRDTLHHACLSMFVTSVTTATACFGSIISKITAVRCFSIFAGTAVLVNFIFTVLLLPASVILAEKWCSATCDFCIPSLGVYFPQCQRIWGSSIFNSIWKLQFNLYDLSRIFFEKVLPSMIIKPRFFWIILFTGLAAGGAFVVCHYPKLRLPDSREFQIFSADHPFEKYDLALKKYFYFAKAKNQEVYPKLPIRVVWGILPVDNGNYFDPYDRGSLVFDETFDVSSPDSQTWLLNFCVSLRKESFYQSTHGPMLSNCFIETFKNWMERRCVDGISNIDRTPCCEISRFPYKKVVFDICIKKAISILHDTPSYYLVRSVEGPHFSKAHGNITVTVIEYDSVFTYSSSYNEILTFKLSVDKWFTKMMKTAPIGLKNGFFTSDLDFFDLQDSLSKGTLIAIGVAIVVSFGALLVTTLNLLISIYAIITIAFVIMVTVGSLVLLGWQLNVLESTTVSVAIGLAVDLTLHYAVAYRLSNQEDRKSSVEFVLNRVGSPVAMAAFTTFMVGALMFPSEVLAYLQTAKFLVILMTVSWLYSTFFFLSLLSVMGPENGQLQLNYPSFTCCESSPVSVDKTPYALSESTLSSSSTGYPNQLPTSESHELEPLANMKSKCIEVVKFTKTNLGRQMVRPRSDSFSSCTSRTRDPTFPTHVSRIPRKISLPTVTFCSDLSPKHIFSGESSTILCEEAYKDTSEQAVNQDASDMWLKNDIGV